MPIRLDPLAQISRHRGRGAFEAQGKLHREGFRTPCPHSANAGITSLTKMSSDRRDCSWVRLPHANDSTK